MKKLLLLITLTLLPLMAYSQEGFKYALTDDDGIEYYYNIKSDLMGISKEVWIKKVTPAKHIKNKKGKLITINSGYSMTLMEISCSYQTYRIKQSIKYSNNGKVLSSNDNSSFEQNIVPGSVMDGIARIVCEKE